MAMNSKEGFLPYVIGLTSVAIALLVTLRLEPFLLATDSSFFYIAIILGIFSLTGSIINLLTRNFRGDKPEIKPLDAEGTLRARPSAEEKDRLIRLAPSGAEMGMWNWDILTGKNHWSPDQEQLFGLTPGTFDGKYETFLSYVHPEDREIVNRAIEQAIESKSLYQSEYRIVWADGSVHWIEARGHAFYNQAGEPIQMTGTVTALDQCKQAQGLLQQKFEQQRLVMEVTQRIRNSLNLEDIFQTTVEEIRQLLRTDRVIIFQFDPKWRGTVLVESVGKEWTAILANEIYDPCFGEQYVEPYKQGLITAKSDIYNARIDPCHLELLANFQVRANLVVPVVKGGELWGLLIAHHCAGPRGWQSSEIDLMKQLAGQLSIAIQQSELFEQVRTELAERKQAEALLRLFAQYAPAGIAMLDRDMRYLMASQRWVEQYKLESVESLIGRSHYEIFPEIPAQWREIHQRCLAGAAEKSEEDLFIRSDGSEQWICWEIHPWYTSTDEIGGIIIFSVEISNLKQTEIALRQSQIQLKRQLAEIEAIYQSAPIGLNVLDTELRFVRINERLAEMNGLPLEAHIGHTIRELLPELADTAEPVLRRILETGEPILNVEIVGETPAQPGVQRTWLESFLPLKDGERIIGISTVCEEITERKKAQMALQQLNAELEERIAERTAELTKSNDRFRCLSESSPVGIFMTDSQGECIYTNPRYEAMCGCGFDELAGEGWMRFIHPEDREEVTTEWLKAVSEKREYAADEIRYLRKDETIRYGRVRSAAIFSVSGELTGYVGTVEDVTDSRVIEIMKKEFISIVSHELRTPLASIRGSMGLVASGVLKNKPETAQQMLDIAVHDTERLVRLVNDILDLERLEAQKVNLNRQWCDAMKLMRQSVETVQSLAVDCKITLSLESTDLQVWADSDRITQTLVNLVSNAIKFSPPHTTVTLSVQDGADEVLFAVKDRGRGIPADKLETIFGRFQQVDASDSRQKGGTGLGLAICKNIIQQHGGKIWAESIIGEGSSFYFTLPKLLD